MFEYALHVLVSVSKSRITPFHYHMQWFDSGQMLLSHERRKSRLPALQLVIMESSVKVNQHSGSGSILFD